MNKPPRKPKLRDHKAMRNYLTDLLAYLAWRYPNDQPARVIAYQVEERRNRDELARRRLLELLLADEHTESELVEFDTLLRHYKGRRAQRRARTTTETTNERKATS